VGMSPPHTMGAGLGQTMMQPPWGGGQPADPQQQQQQQQGIRAHPVDTAPPFVAGSGAAPSAMAAQLPGVCETPAPPLKRSRPAAPHLHYAAVFAFLVELKPRALRRAVKAKSDGDVVNTSCASASAALLFEWAGSDGNVCHTPCDEFVQWLLCSMLADMAGRDAAGDLDDDLHLLLMFAEHDGLRLVLLDCCLLPPLLCLAFRVFFDLLKHGAAVGDGHRAEVWLQVLLLLLFKLVNADEDAPVLLLNSFQRTGSDDFAFVVNSLLRVAADNLNGAVGAAPLGAALACSGPGGFMKRCGAAAVPKGCECAGCLAVDICSLLCCSSPESVSYAILSHALKPSLVMHLTLVLFQRLSCPSLRHEHERLAVSWLVRPLHAHDI
jgi:hypothetical protein